jgi:AraC-like DNA-binding protein
VKGPTISSAIGAAVIETAIGCGASRDALIGSDPVSPEPWAIDRLYDLWETAMRATRLVALPIRVGKAAHFARYGAFGIALYVSANMDVALRRLCRYHDLVTDSGQWQMRTERSVVVMSWNREGERRLGLRVANEQMLAAFVNVARALSPRHVPIREVRLRHRVPGAHDEHATHFGISPTMDCDEDAVVLDVSYLDAPIIGCDPHVESFVMAQVDTALGARTARGGTASSVARLIAETLADGIPTIEQIAGQLETSERTLRRRLADDGTTFEDVVIGLQRERALGLLAGPSPLRDIAMAVGFRDASTFTRAFRRWTGKTPSEARRRLSK